MKKARKIFNKEIRRICFIINIFITVCCVLFVQSLKWKLLILISAVVLDLREVCVWLEDAGMNKQAERVKKIDTILFVLFMVTGIIFLVGSVVGLWNL